MNDIDIQNSNSYCNKSFYFKKILNSQFLRNKIFRDVKQIHRQNNTLNMMFDWYDLGCFPVELIRFNQIERFKSIFNCVISAVSSQSYDIEVLNSFLLSFMDSLSLARRDLIELVYQHVRSSSNLCDKINFKLIHDKSMVHGHLPIIQFLHENKIDSVFKGDSMKLAAMHGHLHIVRWLHENRTEKVSESVMDFAAKGGHLEIVKFLFTNRTEGCSSAAKDQCKHLPTAQFLHQNLTDPLISYKVAVESGDLELVKFTLESYPEQYKPYYIIHAITNKQYEIATYLLENRTEGKISGRTMNSAAFQGNFELVKKIHVSGRLVYPHNEIQSAAMSLSENRLEIIEFLHQHRQTVGSMDNIDAPYWAASQGDLELCKFLHRNGYRGSMSVNQAALNGHTEVLRFCTENRTELLSSNILGLVAENQHFETLQYIFQNRSEVTLNDEVMDRLAIFETPDAMEWFSANSNVQFTSNAYYFACENNRLANFQWLYEKMKVSLRKDIDQTAASRGRLEIIKYLHTINAPFSQKTMDFAAISKNLDLVAFLHLNRTEGCSPSTPSYSHSFAMTKLLLNCNCGNISEDPIYIHYLKRLEFIKVHKL
ncbi:hypothetical protein PPL_04129 [Heterostelium album PN500]|uniref:Ankyrin repeat protein n=1 Tax=Heterostelium pallidum (strain ATCC 26659 / Pp 5 / PN500) TaxID=670386 RepID=D3B638_HETP5|nr:hypothetical protein PPL_04129 [Heterostelium album PN500]EFA83336.1 hypothetical protein PPL_04129 [Heterostelium album PN500]|eukprot:XP_020435453.1 hypothetical protein PPL_04129 [Heterostelium album PN500]